MEGLGQAGLMFKALSALRGPQGWLGGSFRSKEEGEWEMGEGGQGGLAPWKRGYRTQLGRWSTGVSRAGRMAQGARRSSRAHSPWAVAGWGGVVGGLGHQEAMFGYGLVSGSE